MGRIDVIKGSVINNVNMIMLIVHIAQSIRTVAVTKEPSIIRSKIGEKMHNGSQFDLLSLLVMIYETA